jgi:hypothetical protein
MQNTMFLDGISTQLSVMRFVSGRFVDGTVLFSDKHRCGITESVGGSFTLLHSRKTNLNQRSTMTLRKRSYGYCSCILVALVPLILASAIELRNLRFVDDDSPVPVLIGFKDSSYSKGTRVGVASSSSYHIQADIPALRRVNAVKANLSRN